MRINVAEHLPLVRVMARDVARASDVDDVVQEVALRLLRRPADVKDPAALPAFLRTVTRRESARMHQRATRDLPATLSDVPETFAAPAVVDDEGPADPEGRTPERFPRDLFGAPVLPGIASDRMAAAVRLHYFDGLPCAVVGRRLGVTAGAVRMLLLRARLAMRGAK